MTSAAWKKLFLFAVLIAVIVVTAVTRIGISAEDLTSKHYFNSADGKLGGYYYSGWAGRFFVYQDGLKPLHMESGELYAQAYGFLRTISPGEPLSGIFLQGGYQSARYFSASFLPSLIARLGGGTLTVIDSYLITAILLWLASIVAIYKLAGIYTRDPLAPYIAAILLASWPVFTLALDTIKIQNAGIATFVIGLYLHESQVRRFPPMAMFIYYVAFWYIALQTSGGWPWFMSFMVWRFLWLLYKTPGEWRDRVRELAVIVASIVPAFLWLDVLHTINGLKSSFHARGFGFSRMIGESLEFVWAFLRGQDIGSLKFANLPGSQFFIDAVPRIVMGFIRANPVLATLGGVAFIFVPRTRWLLLITPVLLFIGCGAIYVGTGEVGNVVYFGYFAGGTTIMVMIAVAAMLANFFAMRSITANIASLVSLAAVLFIFMGDYKSRLDSMYWDRGIFNRVDKIYVYHGKNVTAY